MNARKGSRASYNAILTLVMCAWAWGSACGPQQPQELSGRRAALFNYEVTSMTVTNSSLMNNASPLLPSCAEVGETCCPADSEVLTTHCERADLGCNINTGKCETCGGAGQPCCDSHTSPFNSSGVVYFPNPLDPVPNLCSAGGTCDARRSTTTGLLDADTQGSRMCGSCGTYDGAACCPDDAEFSAGRCSGDVLDNNRRLSCVKTPESALGTCKRCGGLNEPACETNTSEGELCETGSVPSTVVNGTCVACGFDGLVACDTGEPCRDQPNGLGSNEGVDGMCHACGWVDMPLCQNGDLCRQLHSAPRSGTCVQAGGMGEPCGRDGWCGYEGYACDYESGTCEQYCGKSGQECCPLGSRTFQCDYGSCDNGSCGGPPPPPPPPPPTCGGAGMQCCSRAVCNDVGYSCVGRDLLTGAKGTCLPRSSGTGGSGAVAKTCSGADAIAGQAALRNVWITNAFTGCAETRSFASNTEQEAIDCASFAWGSLVIQPQNPVPEEFSFCPGYGAGTQYVRAATPALARVCMANLANNGTWYEGACR